MSSSATGLSGRYAGSLYELAAESNKTDLVHNELSYLIGLLNSSKDLKKLIDSPILSREEQQKAIVAVMETAGADKLTTKFLGTLAANGRLSALPRRLPASDWHGIADSAKKMCRPAKW